MRSRLLKQTFDCVSLSLAHKSLSSGTHPQEFKHAAVTPRLKRPHLGQDDMQNYRPISQMSLVSKIVEKVVLQQQLPFLNKDSIGEAFRPGFKAAHSTESALLEVLSDIFLALDKGRYKLDGQKHFNAK